MTCMSEQQWNACGQIGMVLCTVFSAQEAVRKDSHCDCSALTTWTQVHSNPSGSTASSQQAALPSCAAYADLMCSDTSTADHLNPALTVAVGAVKAYADHACQASKPNQGSPKLPCIFLYGKVSVKYFQQTGSQQPLCAHTSVLTTALALPPRPGDFSPSPSKPRHS